MHLEVFRFHLNKIWKLKSHNSVVKREFINFNNTSLAQMERRVFVFKCQFALTAGFCHSEEEKITPGTGPARVNVKVPKNTPIFFFKNYTHSYFEFLGICFTVMLPCKSTVCNVHVHVWLHWPKTTSCGSDSSEVSPRTPHFGLTCKN